MKILLSLFIFTLNSTLYANPIESLRSLIGYGTYQGLTESGERCSLEIDRLRNGVRIFLFNPRVNRFEFSQEDHYELLENGIKISGQPVYEDNARITNSFVLSGRVVGIEREFCTYKCWVSMRPCILD